MPRHEGRNGLSPVVEDLLPINAQDRVAVYEIAHLLTQSQRVNRRLVGAHCRLCVLALDSLDFAEVLAPRFETPRIHLTVGRGNELRQHGPRITEDADVDSAVVADLGRIDVYLDHPGVAVEAWRRELSDDVVEARTEHHKQVRLPERAGSRGW